MAVSCIRVRGLVPSCPRKDAGGSLRVTVEDALPCISRSRPWAAALAHSHTLYMMTLDSWVDEGRASSKITAFLCSQIVHAVKMINELISFRVTGWSINLYAIRVKRCEVQDRANTTFKKKYPYSINPKSKS